MRPLPASATYALPLGAIEMDSAPERTPLPYVPRRVDPRLSYTLMALPTVTQTLSEPSIATPVAPATAHDDRTLPDVSNRLIIPAPATYTTSELSTATPDGWGDALHEREPSLPHEESHPPEDVNAWIRLFPVSAT